MKKYISIFSLILFAVLASAYYFFIYNNQGPESELVFCTMDAKLCPNGTFVSRVAPDCDFAPCPEENSDFSSNFSNEHIEKSINLYLQSRDDFSWNTSPESFNFCSVFNLDKNNELFPFYIWTYCAEYIIEEENIEELNSKSLPLKIDYPNEMSFYNTRLFTSESSIEGDMESDDFNDIFPENIREKISDFGAEKLATENREKAQKNITAWEEIKKLIKDCEVESVFQSHSLEVSAELKNGQRIKAVEPRIDYIIDLAQEAEPTCGDIIMATE